jgi:hypothetical protein
MVTTLDLVKTAIKDAVGEHRRRIEICLQCEHNNETLGICNYCKCPLILKASWIHQTCPLEKWRN